MGDSMNQEQVDAFLSGVASIVDQAVEDSLRGIIERLNALEAKLNNERKMIVAAEAYRLMHWMPDMSMRDLFASQALVGITQALTQGIRPVDLPMLARDCYGIADAMLDLRKGPQAARGSFPGGGG